MRSKVILRVLICVIVFVLLFICLQRLLMPKYTREAEEGRLTAEYYGSDKNHDVLFIGDCEVYENISPVTLWREYGISSYVRGSPQQLIWHSYYMLEDALRYETPKIVVFNVLSMKYGEPQNEAYNRLALDGMRLSSTKINAIKASMKSEESLMSYIFPILRFHSRWNELNSDDLKYMFCSPPQLSVAGYLMRVDCRPLKTDPPVGHQLMDYSFADICWEYLEKIRTLCEENGAKLVLMKAPTVAPYWYAEWDSQIVEYANKHGLAYYNFLNSVAEIGIDYTADTYDEGQHLNVWGAEKLSSFFGKELASLGAPDRRGEADYEQSWAKLCERYDEVKQYQQDILEQTGTITGFPVPD